MQEQQKQEPEAKRFGQVVKDAFKELGETLVAFIKAPRALWGINVPYVLEGLSYFGILTILGKFCSENVALTDPQAGWVYGGVTGGITFAMLLLGGVVDKIGVRTALLLSLATMAIGRFIVSLSGTLPLGAGIFSPMFFTMVGGLLLMVTAYGLYQPAAYAGVKRYTNPQTAAMGYAVLYSLMNLGAFIAGYVADISMDFGESIFPPNGLTAVFWAFTAITVISVLSCSLILTRKVDKHAVARVKREKQVMEESGKIEKSTDIPSEPQPKAKIHNTKLMMYSVLTVLSLVWLVFVFNSDTGLVMRIGFVLVSVALLALSVWEFLRYRPEHPFRDARFMYFIFILIPVQTLFAHNWLTIPYYLDRAFRGNWIGEYWTVFSNINPLLIFIITPIIAGLTARANVYRMMILGTFIMAAPTFLLAIGPLPGLFLTYILIMSIGEAMWQPRFLQWVAEIAPEGQTGAYMGIGQFPWFLTKVLTSLYSGYFVANYIPRPEAGLQQNSGEMWLIYSFIAMLSTIGLLLAKPWMQKGMKERA